MYTVTWIEAGTVRSVSGPTRGVMAEVFAAMRAGHAARFWFNGRRMIG